MSVVSHIATQRTNHGVPHAVSCRLLGVSESWYYKWRSRRPTTTEQRRAALHVKVRIVFETSARTYGSPRVCAQLRSDGERVSEKTVARSMRTQGLVARQKRRRRGLTRPDKAAPVAPDLIRRDFTASRSRISRPPPPCHSIADTVHKLVLLRRGHLHPQLRATLFRHYHQSLAQPPPLNNHTRGGVVLRQLSVTRRLLTQTAHRILTRTPSLPASELTLTFGVF